MMFPPVHFFPRLVTFEIGQYIQGSFLKDSNKNNSSGRRRILFHLNVVNKQCHALCCPFNHVEQ